MATDQLARVIRTLRDASLHNDGAGLTDGQLLENYVRGRREAALAALVHRHGPMVWGVCRRALPSHQDAEDAFQATFLVLVRKAASIASRELVANWLYGVARQTARKANATIARRGARERQVTKMPEPAMEQQEDNLQPLLDQALSCLPDKYRAVVLLCELEGKTRKEVARQLKVPEGTVASRLATARTMLARRLLRQGVVLSSGALAALLAQNLASANMPPGLASNTIRAASLWAAGRAAAAGAISTRVAALAEGVLKAMMMSKLKTALAWLLVIGMLGLGGAGVVRQTGASAHGDALFAERGTQETMPDPSGAWHGDDWGTVDLRAAKEGGFAGTYSDTFGKDVGRIAVKWAPASRRYEGAWSEGKFRFGRIALEVAKDGKTIAGAWTTDPKCEHDPGVPSLASLSWRRADPATASPSDKLRRIGLAMQAYFDRNQTYPGPALYSKDGKPLLSWRVALLPYLNEADLFKQFRLDEPWDSAHNKKLLASMPAVFRGAGSRDETTTPFQVFVGKGTIFEGPGGLGYRDIPDGTSNTITVVEAAAMVPWTKPEDLPYSATGKIADLGNASPDIAYALCADGKVHALKSRFDTDALRLAITRDDGIPTPWNKLLAPAGPRREPEIEDLTAWGEEVGGLQAGLGYRPGQKRVYHHGETARLVVRVRNVSKQEVKFQYDREIFAFTSPRVTDSAGRPVRIVGTDITDTFEWSARVAKQVTLAPGKEIELAEWKTDLKPTSEKNSENPGAPTLFGTGRFLLHYQELTPKGYDPVLGKLATGILELEVVPTPAPEKRPSVPGKGS